MLKLIRYIKAKRHKHNWCITEISNAIQYDDMGYPLRLYIEECDECGDSRQVWIDTIEFDDDVCVKWRKNDLLTKTK